MYMHDIGFRWDHNTIRYVLHATFKTGRCVSFVDDHAKDVPIAFRKDGTNNISEPCPMYPLEAT